MYRRYQAALVAAFLALTGCAQVQQAVTLDASGAVTMAKADGSPAALARAQCYAAIPPIVQPVNGVLTFYEQLMQAKELAQGPCAPIIAGVTR